MYKYPVVLNFVYYLVLQKMNVFQTKCTELYLLFMPDCLRGVVCCGELDRYQVLQTVPENRILPPHIWDYEMCLMAEFGGLRRLWYAHNSLLPFRQLSCIKWTPVPLDDIFLILPLFCDQVRSHWLDKKCSNTSTQTPHMVFILCTSVWELFFTAVVCFFLFIEVSFHFLNFM